MIAYLFGVFTALIAMWAFLKFKIRPQIEGKTFASMRWSASNNKWLVVGDPSAVIEKVSHAKPGSIKYID